MAGCVADYHWMELNMTIKREDLATTDFGGEVTGSGWHEFVAPLGLSARSVARDIEESVTAQSGACGDGGSPLRLGRRFGTSTELWLGVPATNELELEREALGWAA